MNHIKIENMTTPYGYKELHWFIDGKALVDYLEEWAPGFDEQTMHYIKIFRDLSPAWTKELDWYGDVRFVWKLIEDESAVLPVLLCSDDLDFSCIVMVVEVEKTRDFIYWKRIGYVDEELYRRRMNYTYPYYRTEGNVRWIYEMNWTFSKDEYNQMADNYWKYETLIQLNTYKRETRMTVKDCAHLISTLTRNGKELLSEHIYDYGEILLHLFAGEQIGEPLVRLFSSGSDDKTAISIYCKATEIMWRYGNDAVINVVDVTLLERLSDDNKVWEKFGTCISDDFKSYINDSVLKENLMMGGVKPLV